MVPRHNGPQQSRSRGGSDNFGPKIGQYFQLKLLFQYITTATIIIIIIIIIIIMLNLLKYYIMILLYVTYTTEFPLGGLDSRAIRTNLPPHSPDVQGTTAGLTNLRHAWPKWHAEFTAVSVFFYFFFPISVSILWTCVCVCVCVCVCIYIYIYIYISDHVEIVYELPFLPNNTASTTFFTQIGSRAKCWLDMYHWGAGRAMTGRICDNGQEYLTILFSNRSTSSPRYFQTFFLIALLEEACIRNIFVPLH